MRHKTSRRRCTCRYAAFEPRQLLASIGFENGEVLVQGNATDDLIELSGSSDFRSFTIRINNDANLTETFQYSEVDQLTVFAGSGNDRVLNTLQRGTLIYGGAGNDVIEGGYRSDLLFGGSGIDTLIGRSGDDTIRGQDGVDWMYGGPGSDRLFGFEGNDRLFGGAGIDSLFGDAGDDELRGNDGADRLVGGPGADRIFGEAGEDELFGGSENDVLVGGLGNDRLLGNSGNDLLNGNEGNDTILAGLGDDRVNGGLGDDEIFGNSGSNELNGNGGQDQINGGTGADEIDGGSGNDRLAGGDGDDRLAGKEGEDVLYGGSGNDFLLGGRDDDFLAGQAGDDLLNGEFGENVMFGNDGNDRFAPLNNARINGGAGVDEVAIFAGQYEVRVERVGSSIRLTDIRASAGTFLWMGESTLTDIEQFDLSEEDGPIPTERLLWQPIVERIIVQPVVVSDDDGSNTSIGFGDAEDEAEVKRRVDRIYNQAGVDVEFLPTKYWSSTFANGVGEGVRNGGEFLGVFRQGDAAGIGSPDSLVIDYYFVDRAPGLAKPTSTNGVGALNKSGATQAVNQFVVDSVARVLAHEIGHNLGLRHTDESEGPTLLGEDAANEFLTASQIEQILASDITRPV